MWMHCNDSSVVVERVRADWVITIENGDHFYVTFLIELTTDVGAVFGFVYKKIASDYFIKSF